MEMGTNLLFLRWCPPHLSFHILWAMRSSKSAMPHHGTSHAGMTNSYHEMPRTTRPFIFNYTYSGLFPECRDILKKKITIHWAQIQISNNLQLKAIRERFSLPELIIRFERNLLSSVLTGYLSLTYPFMDSFYAILHYD